MNVLVLSNVNLAPLTSKVPGHDVSVGDYGDVLRALADPSSPAHSPGVDAVAVVVDGDELLASGSLADELVPALGTFAAARPEILVVAGSAEPDPAGPRTFAAAAEAGGPGARAGAYNAALRDLATEHANVVILDLGLVMGRFGREVLISPTYWYAGRIPYTARWFAESGTLLARLLDAHLSSARKVLVCDLDNTLWGGVLGEDGPGGIALGEDGVGKCFRDLQRRIKELQQTGVLLALASKNDSDDVAGVLADHPMMILRADDFAAQRVDWNDKATSIASIADELSLGLDAFVFLDDNPVERALVAEMLPDVAVPDAPQRPELLPSWFVREVAFGYFAKVRVLDADAAKTTQYRARQRRQAAETSSSDLAGFLERLAMELDLRVDDEFLVERAAQMTQKTNQFNLTMRRCSPGEVREMMDAPRYAVVTVGYQDRFGDEGVVGLAILDGEEGAVEVLLLSCRVIGRGVEERLLDHVEDVARRRGLTSLRCTFVPTDRNGVAARFLPGRGWVPDAAAPDGTVTYRRELS